MVFVKRVAFELLWVVLIIIKFQLTECSIGNYDRNFLDCVDSCNNYCQKKNKGPLPFALRVFGWSCQDNCKYECMHIMTSERIRRGKKIVQYYGKWPFIRLLGMQEPASVIFSLLNLLAHLFGIIKLMKVKDVDQFQLYGVFKVYCLVNMNAWVWSMVFHSRDLRWTEKMDYFCATSVVISSMFTGVTRVIGKLRDTRVLAVGASLLAMYMYHICFMNFVHFDYAYNIKFNVIIGFLNTAVWLGWCYAHRKERPHVWKCATALVLISISAALEVFDFPPFYGIFDAHSLWHLSTAPLTYFWYCFMEDDAKFEISRNRAIKTN